AIEIETDSSLVRRDQRQDHLADVAAGEIMRLQWVACDIDSRFHRSDAVVHDQTHWDFAQTHSNHFADADRRTGNACPQPSSEKFKENNDENEGNDGNDGEADKDEWFHGSTLAKVIPAEKLKAKFCGAVGPRQCEWECSSAGPLEAKDCLRQHAEEGPHLAGTTPRFSKQMPARFSIRPSLLDVTERKFTSLQKAGASRFLLTTPKYLSIH